MNSRTQKRALLTTLALAGALSAAACRMAPRGSYNSVESGRPGQDPVQTIGNRDIANSLELRNIVEARQNDLKIVQVELVNRLGRAIQFQWSPVWYDRSGIVIDYGPAHFEPVRLSGRQTKVIKFIAPSPAADTWKLQYGSRDEVQ